MFVLALLLIGMKLPNNVKAMEMEMEMENVQKAKLETF